MQEVAHHLLGDLAVGLDELIAEVEKANPLAVVQLVEGLVDLEGLGALGAEILAEGENAQQQDFGLGQLLAEFLDVFWSSGMLLTPMSTTATLGLRPSRLPWSRRQRTCWV